MPITADDIKKMSSQTKAFGVIGIFIVIGILYYIYFFGDLLQEKISFATKLEATKTQIKQREQTALQLDKYIAEVEALKQNYKIALKKLPDQREIPGLFHAVASSGKETGIDFLLFEPKAAVPKTMVNQVGKAAQASNEQKQSAGKKAQPEPEPFYEEIPVQVTVIGHFQNILHFFEKVAKLPRIVNISEITMGDRKNVKGRGYLITATCTIKTYMFIDKKEKTDGKSL